MTKRWVQLFASLGLMACGAGGGRTTQSPPREQSGPVMDVNFDEDACLVSVQTITERETEKGWTEVSRIPAAGVPIEVTFQGREYQKGEEPAPDDLGTARAITDASGRARIEYGKVQLPERLCRARTLHARVVMVNSPDRDANWRLSDSKAFCPALHAQQEAADAQSKAGLDASSLAPNRQALADTDARLAEQAEQDRAKGVVLAKLERWARAALSVKWSEQAHIDEHCFNRVDTEVSCNGPAAFRKETNAYNETFALVHNRSAVPLVCRYDWGMPNGGDLLVGASGAATVAAGTQQAFKKTHPVVLFAPPVPRAVVCAGKMDAIVKAAGLPSDAARTFGGDGKTAMVGLHNDPQSKTESVVVGIDGRMFLKRGDGFDAIR